MRLIKASKLLTIHSALALLECFLFHWWRDSTGLGSSIDKRLQRTNEHENGVGVKIKQKLLEFAYALSLNQSQSKAHHRDDLKTETRSRKYFRLIRNCILKRLEMEIHKNSHVGIIIISIVCFVGFLASLSRCKTIEWATKQGKAKVSSNEDSKNVMKILKPKVLNEWSRDQNLIATSESQKFY